MNRRDLLVAAGVGAAGGLGAWYLLQPSRSADIEHPGTLDTSFATNGAYPEDGDPGDGLPPTFPDAPAAPDADPSSFETLDVNGETVRLAPIDVVHDWYRRGEARFVDARGLAQYERSHVYGAVSSSAEQGSSGGGIQGWPEDARIVTYCGCPHHLSSMRAAGLQKAGYGNVFALDEGFGPWFDRSYPMAGTTFDGGATNDVREWDLNGAVDARYAGEYAWARTEGSHEAAPIRADGTFTVTVRFPDATSETPVEVSTPAFTVTDPLGDLAERRIDGQRA